MAKSSWLLVHGVSLITVNFVDTPIYIIHTMGASGVFSMGGGECGCDTRAKTETGGVLVVQQY
jgi:hypothetical protein